MKFIIKKRLQKVDFSKIEIEDIKKSQTILFSVYSRFGDGIISFKIINELIEKYPNKKYYILTSKQLYPYAKEIIKNADIWYTNKRNPIEFFYTIYKLNKIKPDLGFNPWGHGDDSEFFISFAKKFSFYKQEIKVNKTFNLYDRVRVYLKLPIKNKIFNKFEMNHFNHIVIAPLSTDITKNMTKEAIDKLLTKLNANKITIATPKSLGYKNEFIFKKSLKNSKNFISLLKTADLFVGVDSGPLHIADTLGIKSIGIFGPTAPETILDYNTNVMPIRTRVLNKIFCFVKSCKYPECIEKGLSEFNICSFNEKIYLEEDKCPL